jgi:hypothetical protein
VFRSKFVSNICNPMLNNKYSKRRLGIFHGLPPRSMSCGIGVPGGMGAAGSAGTGIAHKVGCKCHKLACLWKYCECFSASTWCSLNCCWVGCMNRAPGAGSMRDHLVAWDASTTVTTLCTCQKLQCLKLYCACFSLLVMCDPNCRCQTAQTRTRHQGHNHKESRRVLFQICEQHL